MKQIALQSVYHECPDAKGDMQMTSNLGSEWVFAQKMIVLIKHCQS